MTKQHLLFFAMFLGCFLPVLAQNARSDGVVQSRSGFPAPGASVAVCTQTAITAATEAANIVTITSTLNPPQGSTVTIVGVTPTQYNGAYVVLTTSGTNFTYTNPTAGLGAGTVFGSVVVTSATPCAPLANLCASYTDTTCASSNPVTADGLGNYSFYVKPGHYTVQFYGSGLTARVQTDQILPCDPANCTLRSIGKILFIDDANTAAWAGADVCAQENSAEAALPATGGIIDMRGLTAATLYACSGTWTIGSSKAVYIYLPPGMINPSGTPAIIVKNASFLIGINPIGNVGGSSRLNASVATADTVQWQGSYGGMQDVFINTGTGSAFRILATASLDVRGNHFRNVRVACNASGAGSKGFYLTSFDANHLATENAFEHPTSQECETDVQLDAATTQGPTNNWFRDFASASTSGQGVAGINIINGDVNYFGPGHINNKATCILVSGANPNKYNSFEGLRLESCTTDVNNAGTESSFMHLSAGGATVTDTGTRTTLFGRGNSFNPFQDKLGEDLDVRSFEKIVYVDDANTGSWTGADVCAQATNAVSTLPAQGGILDMRGLTAATTYNCAATWTIGSSTKPVYVYLPSALLFITPTAASPAIAVPGASFLIGVSNSCAIGGSSRVQVNGTAADVIKWQGSFGGMQDVCIDANNLAGLHLLATAAIDVRGNTFRNIRVLCNGSAANSIGVELTAFDATHLVTENTFSGGLTSQECETDLKLDTGSTQGPTDNWIHDITIASTSGGGVAGVNIVKGDLNHIGPAIVTGKAIGVKTAAGVSQNEVIHLDCQSDTACINNAGTGTAFLGFNLGGGTFTDTGTNSTVISYNNAVADKLPSLASLNTGRILPTGTALTSCAVTGAGASGSCSAAGNSVDSFGELAIAAAGAAPAASGTLTITFSAALGTNRAICQVQPMSTDTAWNARAELQQTSNSTANVVLNWDNNAAVLVAANTYRVSYICFGR